MVEFKRVEEGIDYQGRCLVYARSEDGALRSFLVNRHDGKWRHASSAAFWYAVPIYWMPVPLPPEGPSDD